MDSLKKVAVIIPTYNIEKKIRRCIKSIQAQSINDIEIIVVDDCSSDSTCEIVHNMAKNDSRITLVQLNKNEGQANARNIGIDTSNAEYLSFVDGDDFIKSDFLETMIYEIKNSKAEIVCGGALVLKQERNKLVHLYNDSEFKEKKEYYLSDKMSEEDFQFIFSQFVHATWNKVYESYFIKSNNIYFPKWSEGEDAGFALYAAMKANKIVFIPYLGYRWIHYPEKEKNNRIVFNIEAEKRRWHAGENFIKCVEQFAKKYSCKWTIHSQRAFETCLAYNEKTIKKYECLNMKEKTELFKKFIKQEWVQKRFQMYGMPSVRYFSLRYAYRDEFFKWYYISTISLGIDRIKDSLRTYANPLFEIIKEKMD